MTKVEEALIKPGDTITVFPHGQCEVKTVGDRGFIVCMIEDRDFVVSPYGDGTYKIRWEV